MGALWNIEAGTVVELKGRAARIPDTDVVAMWPCGRMLALEPGRTPRHGRERSRERCHLECPNRRARSNREGNRDRGRGAFSPDGRRVVVVDGSRPRAQIWTVSPLEPTAQVPRRAADQPLRSAQFVGDPLRVLTVDVDGRAVLSNAASGETVAFRDASFPAAVAATSDGSRVAVGTTDGWLRVFSHGGRPVVAKKATDGVVTTLAFSSGGGVIATGGQRGTAVTWDGRKLARTPLHAFGGGISGATFSPAGGLLLVTSEKKARLWDRTLRRVVLELPSAQGVRAEFSPDGSQIVIAGRTRLEVLPCIACLPVTELERRARSLLPPPRVNS